MWSVEPQPETANIDPDKVCAPSLADHDGHRFRQGAGRDDLPSTDRLARRIASKFLHKKAQGVQGATQHILRMAEPREAIVPHELHAKA